MMAGVASRRRTLEGRAIVVVLDVEESVAKSFWRNIDQRRCKNDEGLTCDHVIAHAE